MLTHFKKANLTFVLLLIISLCLSGNVKAAPEDSGLYRASFTKKSPSNNATGVTVSQPTLQWNSASNVFRYVYCYYSYDLTSNVCDINDKSTWKSNGTSTSVQLPNLVPNKKYYWQVGAKLNDNSFIYADGALTSKWAFTTGSAPSVGEGIYDNTHSNWTYTGKWVASTYTGTETGPYNKTYKESGDIPDYATFTFTGSRVALYYIQEPERGVMNIYMDNSTTPIALDQSGPLTWQKMWMSGALASGTHTIKLVYVSGKSVNIDAIQVYAQADTIAPAAINLSAAAGTNAGTVVLNWTAVGDDGNTAGGAAKNYFVRYSATQIVTETDWNNASAVTNGIPTPK
ncbi:MAG TPA: hypothetical protein VFQ13_13725, partial [Anaerolineales bacterium]|nr:hypothetical protein [Anaerolineales bacterium]